MRTIVHTLGYNIPTLIEECTESLRSLNEGFEYTHVIADLGYPLQDGRDNWEISPKDTDISVNNSVDVKLVSAEFQRVPVARVIEEPAV